jgi:hypothetical protein
MRGSSHPISDKPNVAFSSEVGTGSREENASKESLRDGIVGDTALGGMQRRQ